MNDLKNKKTYAWEMPQIVTGIIIETVPDTKIDDIWSQSRDVGEDGFF